MQRAYRVAVGGIFTECNQLGGKPTDLPHYERSELRWGEQILAATSGVLGGALQVLREREAVILPLVFASSNAGGPLTAECYATLKGEMLKRLRAAPPVDGVLLLMHGSGAVTGTGHLEDDLVPAVRALVGKDAPIVGTLDLHAHVTAPMIRDADAWLAWETYPHRDSYQTGQRGARLLCDTLAGACRPTMTLAKVPVLVGGVNGGTEGDGPFADVMRFAKAHEGHHGVLSTSVLLVHPYLDMPDMGGGGIVITDNDPAAARALATEIAERYWARRFDLDPRVYTPAAAIAEGLKVAGGPVLLVETADCAGGGATGDSAHSLRALLLAGVQQTSFAPVVDPEAAAICHAAGVGARVELAIGHKLDPKWGRPVAVTGSVQTLSDGRFVYQGGVWANQWGNMGPAAVLQVGAIQVLLTTHATYDWADEQYQSVGLDARRAKFVVAKNPMNYRLGYGAIAKANFILDTPGPTPAILHHVRYANLPRPYYPADSDIAGLAPTVYAHGG
jgi:microcystin degradation protein MlrC